MESQRDSCVLKLAERSSRDDEIIALANAALETCVSDDDITELPEGYHLSPEELEEYEAAMYRQEIKRRLEKLIEERKAAAINEAKDMLVSLASMGKNAKEKRREVKKIIQERKKEEKKYKVGLEKLKRAQKGKRATTIAIAHTLHLGRSARTQRRHSALSTSGPPTPESAQKPVQEVSPRRVASVSLSLLSTSPPAHSPPPLERKKTDKL